MLLSLLPEIQHDIFSYCSLSDLRNLSRTNSTYNEILQEMLFHTIKIKSAEVERKYFSTNRKMKKILEKLEYAKVLQFLSGSVMSKSVCRTVRNLTNLTELNLRDIVGVKDTHIRTLCERLFELKILNISRSAVTDDGLIHAQKLHSLTELDISGCPVKGLFFIAALTSLKKLNASHCNNLTDVGVARCALTELNVSWCYGITDVGVAHIATMNALKKLNVSGCYRITDVGVAHIATMNSLTELHVGGDEITDVGVAHIFTMDSLTSLITDASLAHIASLR